MTSLMVGMATVLGARHAIAPDHLAAVGTYTEKAGTTKREGLSCALRIAAGHSAGMLIMAAIIMGLATSLPPAWGSWTTWGTSLWLAMMAGWIFWDLIRDLWKDRFPYRPTESRPYAPAWLVRPTTAWFIGLLFGIAVSPGDLAIFTLMIQHHVDPLTAFALLMIFLATMFAGLGAVGSGLGWANTRAGLRRTFQAISGVLGMGVVLALTTGWSLH